MEIADKEQFAEMLGQATEFMIEFRKRLEEEGTQPRLIRLIDEKLIGFGLKRCGPNIVISKFVDTSDSLFGRIRTLAGISQEEESKDDGDEKAIKRRERERQEKEKVHTVAQWFGITPKEIRGSIIAGFELATTGGPLCDEPMIGCCFILDHIQLTEEATASPTKPPVARQGGEEVKVQPTGDAAVVVGEGHAEAEETKSEHSGSKSTGFSSNAIDNFGPFTGQIISSVKDLCRRAFLNADPRIVEGMFMCNMQATPDNYGKIYGVIQKVRGRVISEEVQDGTNNFLFQVLIPVIESFIFNEEIRKKSCGIAYPQLVFHGWEINENDPFYVPLTEEEIEEHGEGESLPPNPAKVIIEKVRYRKGMAIDKKVVASGEGQRTLSKKK